MKILLLLLTVTFIIACEKSNKQSITINQEIENKRIAELFLKKYDAKSLSFITGKFSFQIEDSLSRTNHVYYSRGRLFDILKRDSGFIVKIGMDEMGIIFRLTANSQMVDNITHVDFRTSKNKAGLFIFKIDKIQRISPQTTFTIDHDENGAIEYSYLDFDFYSALYFIDGSLIDFTFDSK